jgi:multidrug resistance efflux pump
MTLLETEPLSRKTRWRLSVVLGACLLVAILLAGSLIGGRLLFRPTGSHHGSGNGDAEVVSHDGEPDDRDLQTVVTIRPKHNKLFVRSETAPAFVEAYYKADLFAEVPGSIRYIQKNIGDFVTAGEVLVEIDAPDLVADVARKEAQVKQAQAVLVAAAKDVLTLEAEEKTAAKAVDEKLAELKREEANVDFRKYRVTLAKAQVSRDVIAPERLEEVVKEARVAEAAWKSAGISVDKAKLDLEVAKAKVEAARAEVQVKKELVAVAQEDKKRAEAQVGFSQIRAPFNGVIIKRNFDPGSFVQNAATARTIPILTLMRLDLVTVYANAPEKAAPYITNDVNTIIQIETSQGRSIQNLRGKVTRFAPSLDPEKGRTMRVEVDLYNPPERGYKRSCTKGVAAFLAPLGGVSPLSTACALAAGQRGLGRRGLLKDGMYGTMKLVLEKFENAYVIPSGAVFTRDRKTYMFQVQTNGHGKHIARRVPVHVEYEDGVQALVSIVEREAGPEAGDEEVLRPLTGSEEIVLSDQAQISDRQEVEPTGVEW